MGQRGVRRQLLYTLAGEHMPHECGGCGYAGRQQDADTTRAACSECGASVPVNERNDTVPDFCPRCGLDTMILACPACGGRWRIAHAA
jgi:rRNA maturation protein Nop10